MVVNYGACRMMMFRAGALHGEQVFVKLENCHAEHTAIYCLYFAVVFPFLINYAHAHLTVYTDVFP